MVFSKSQIAEATFNLKKNIEFNPIYGQDLIGVLIASAFNKASDIKQQIQKEKIDDSVRMVYEKYMDIHTLKPKETYQTFAYIGDFIFVPDQSMVKMIMPLGTSQIESVYTYVPDWMTCAAYEK